MAAEAPGHCLPFGEISSAPGVTRANTEHAENDDVEVAPPELRGG